jgi:gas vesicle protein
LYKTENWGDISKIVSALYAVVHIQHDNFMILYKHKSFPSRKTRTRGKDRKEMKDMKKKNKSGFFAFLLGGMIGATIGLLYAPQSGEETRKILIDEGQEMVDNAKTSIQEAQERIEKLQEIAKNTLQEQKDSLVKSYSNAKEVVME